MSTNGTDRELVIEDDTSSQNDSNDEEGWESVEQDEAVESFLSLFDNQKFDNINAMFEHCKVNYQFDVWQLQKQYDLDFLGLVKLVNYTRKQVKASVKPDFSSLTSFEDDEYLLPVMESDAVLYNLEQVLQESRPIAKSRIEELEDELAALNLRFDAYRGDVANYLGDKFENVAAAKEDERPGMERQIDGDTEYFHSYSFNSIHELMLKDSVRTDAYRDFIYDNKDIFHDKVVLDVGCGTGILSMFCAKAGAKQVIAVDNSDIISTARMIVKANNLDHIVHCIKGKIEDVRLPVEKVDIIVSEWMGYCLLFESMFNSVITARDRYLSPNGLMVPSHANIMMGLLTDSETRESHINFWDNVYGFNMQPMVKRAREECLIKVINSEEVPGESVVVKTLNLHKVSVKDLDFSSPFKTVPAKSAERFDGFAVWFDMFFAREQNVLERDLNLETAKKHGMTTMTTSPHSTPTHWQQGVCFIDEPAAKLDQKPVSGSISFARSSTDRRALDISVQWQLGNDATQKQVWRVLN